MVVVVMEVVSEEGGEVGEAGGVAQAIGATGGQCQGAADAKAVGRVTPHHAKATRTGKGQGWLGRGRPTGLAQPECPVATHTQHRDRTAGWQGYCRQLDSVGVRMMSFSSCNYTFLHKCVRQIAYVPYI